MGGQIAGNIMEWKQEELGKCEVYDMVKVVDYTWNYLLIGLRKMPNSG